MLPSPRSRSGLALVLAALWAASGVAAWPQTQSHRRKMPARSQHAASKLSPRPVPAATVWTAEAANVRRTSPRIRRCSAFPIRRSHTLLRMAFPAPPCLPSIPLKLSDVQGRRDLSAHSSGNKDKPSICPAIASRGETLFFGKAGCSGCHMVAGQGGFIASDLSALRSHSHRRANSERHHQPRSGQRPAGATSDRDHSRRREICRQNSQ